MTAYTLATNRSTTFSLAAADTLTVTSQGSVHVIDPGAVAIAGAGANVLSIDGFVSSSNATPGIGVRLEFGSSAIALGSHATVVGAWGILINGGSNAVANSGTVIGRAAPASCRCCKAGSTRTSTSTAPSPSASRASRRRRSTTRISCFSRRVATSASQEARCKRLRLDNLTRRDRGHSDP
jgi:hypothetical protein